MRMSSLAMNALYLYIFKVYVISHEVFLYLIKEKVLDQGEPNFVYYAVCSAHFP